MFFVLNSHMYECIKAQGSHTLNEPKLFVILGFLVYHHEERKKIIHKLQYMVLPLPYMELDLQVHLGSIG
jgi:hypothetical protein